MRLLEEARWMDGAVWTLLMFTVFASVELLVLDAHPDAGFWTRQAVVWGLAGAGYAILSGWLARKQAERDVELATATPEGRAEDVPDEPEPTISRAERRRTAKAAKKKEEKGR